MLQESVTSLDFSAFAAARQTGWETAARQKQAGRPLAGCFCSYTPVELLEAAGVCPISLTSVTEEHINDAEIDLPRNLCPLIKASYGDILSQANPYVRLIDLVIGETTCDGKKKMYEYLGNFKKVYTMELPNSQSPDALELWRKEIIKFKEKLEEVFGVTITEDAIREQVKIMNRVRLSLRSFYELMKLDPPPMKGQDMHKVLFGEAFKFDKTALPAEIDALTRQSEEQK